MAEVLIEVRLRPRGRRNELLGMRDGVLQARVSAPPVDGKANRAFCKLFPGGLIVVPALISYWRGVKRVQGAARLGGDEPVNGWIALILHLLLAPGLWAYVQVSLNDLWRKEAEALPGQEPPPSPPDQMPPPLPPEQQPPAPPSS